MAVCIHDVLVVNACLSYAKLSSFAAHDMRKSWTISSNVHLARDQGPDDESRQRIQQLVFRPIALSTMASRIDGPLPQVPMMTLIQPG